MAETDLFQSAFSRLEDALRLIPADPDILEILRFPKETLKARLTIRMDDDSHRSFLAWRCRYEDARGPTKGGIRFHQTVNQAEVESLALWMTIKCAVAGLPYGGAKGGVAVDPDSLSKTELEQLSRAYVRAFVRMIGPERDIPAPDVGTGAMVMGWMADEYAVLTGSPSPAAFTGKPVGLGGSEGREEATALGGFRLIGHVAERLDLKGSERVAIQGLGNVGLELARLFAGAGYRVVAVADSRAALFASDGLDIEAVAHAKAEGRPIADLADGKVIVTAPPGALIGADCDILAPSALENAITAANVDQVRARIVLEMANGPTSPEADAALGERGVVVVPDVLANSGGVIVSYLEWLQNKQGLQWTLEAVREKLRQVIEQEADAVFALAAGRAVSLRAAAYAQGLSRIAEALGAQGVRPDFAPAEKSSLPCR